MNKKKTEPKRLLWCLKSPHGVLVPGDVGIRKKSVINAFSHRKGLIWAILYKEGWRVVPVILKEDPDYTTFRKPVGTCIRDEDDTSDPLELGGVCEIQTKSAIIRYWPVKNAKKGLPVYQKKSDGSLYCKKIQS